MLGLRTNYVGDHLNEKAPDQLDPFVCSEMNIDWGAVTHSAVVERIFLSAPDQPLDGTLFRLPLRKV